MRPRILRSIAIGLFLSLSSLAITAMVPEPSPAQSLTGNFGPDIATGWQILSSTSNTVLTATTTKILVLLCANTSGSAATVTVTDTAGDAVVSQYSIAGHGFQVFIESMTGVIANGVNWWSNAANALSCYLGGKFQNP